MDRLVSDEADVIEPRREAVGGQGGRVAPGGLGAVDQHGHAAAQRVEDGEVDAPPPEST